MNRIILNSVDPAGNCLQVNGAFQVATDIIIPSNITLKMAEEQAAFEKAMIWIKKILFFKLF